jgi:Methyltransferase domain
MSTPSPLPRYIKKIQQHPQELLEFTDFIRQANIKSYLEVGCKFGGMLWSVAHAMPNKGRVVAVDLPFGAWGRSDSEEPLRQCVKELKGEGFDAHLFIGDSTAPHIVQAVQKLGPFDCVFIDANHTEPYVRKDFGNYAHLGRHACFHDIGWNNPTPPNRLAIEVPKVWATLKIDLAERATFREIKRDNGHNGIGIISWLSA